MKTLTQNILILALIISGLQIVAAEETPVNTPFVQNQPNLSDDQKKAMELLESAKKKVDGLMQERNALIQQGAPPEQVQAKSAEVMQAQKDAIEMLRKTFPQGLPPIPGMTMPPPGPPKLSAADQAALDALIAQRKQMVMNGAKFEDVQSITEQIQEKYYGKKLTPPPVSVQTQAVSTQTLVRSPAQSSQTKPT